MTASADERVLVDTNVLVYAANRSASYHEPSRELRDAIAAGQIAGCVTLQILLEYVATVTNPKRVPVAVDAATGWAAAERLASVFTILPAQTDLFAQAIAHGRDLDLKGAAVFDLMIALTALANGVSTVYTYDSTVFAKIPGIVVKTP